MSLEMKIFLALGGAGLVISAIKNGTRPAVKAGLVFLLKKSPAFQKIVIEHEDDIMAVLQSGEEGVKDAIEEEKTVPPAGGC